MLNIREQFGDIDIYLFDQIQKGRFDTEMKILDAGCGGGRNMVWFLRNGFDVSAVDTNESAVAAMRRLAADLAPDLPPENFQKASLESIPFPDECFDWVICSAVLHFARDTVQFDRMLTEMWRVLIPGGVFFARLTSSIGIAELLVPTSNGRFLMPDGSERFIVDEAMIKDRTDHLSGTFIEPIKTTNVENLRCMTTWVVTKDKV